MDNNFQENNNMEIDIIDNEIMNNENIQDEKTIVENKKLPKRNIVLYVSIALIIISIAFRVTYAFYTASVTNTNTPSNTNVTSGQLKIEFGNNTNNINVTDLSLMTAAEAAVSNKNVSTFAVTNNGNVSGKYKLYITNYSITTNLVNADFKWKLTVDGTDYTGTFYDLFNGKTASEGVIASNSDDVALMNNELTLAGSGTHNCEFRVWIQETNQDQLGLTNGSFSGQIKLIAINS